MTVPINPIAITAFVLALVRATAWLFTSPPFNTRMIPTTVKAGIAAALALAAVPHIHNPALPTDTGAFLAALVIQALVGFTLGMFTMLLVNAPLAKPSCRMNPAFTASSAPRKQQHCRTHQSISSPPDKPFTGSIR